MGKSVVVLDYGSGNVRSAVRALERVGAEVSEFLQERDGAQRVFFIGGGGYTLPKFIEHRFPDALIDVAEIPGESRMGLYDPASGALTALHETAVGRGPNWIEIIERP